MKCNLAQNLLALSNSLPLLPRTQLISDLANLNEHSRISPRSRIRGLSDLVVKFLNMALKCCNRLKPILPLFSVARIPMKDVVLALRCQHRLRILHSALQHRSRKQHLRSVLLHNSRIQHLPSAHLCLHRLPTILLGPSEQIAASATTPTPSQHRAQTRNPLSPRQLSHRSTSLVPPSGPPPTIPLPPISATIPATASVRSLGAATLVAIVV
jgi:hypothetical protein